MPAQILRRRGEAVGRIVRPDVAAPVAPEIHGIVLVDTRHELRVPHRPRPGSGHPVRRGVARLNDPQGREQLRGEEPRAPPLPCEGRCRGDHGDFPTPRAETCLHAPDGGHHARGHAGGRLDRRKRRALRRVARPPDPQILVPCDKRQVVFRAAPKFRLVAIPFDHAGQEPLPAKRTIETWPRYPLGQGPRAELRDPGVVVRIRLWAEFRAESASTGRAPHCTQVQGHAARESASGASRTDLQHATA